MTIVEQHSWGYTVIQTRVGRTMRIAETLAAFNYIPGVSFTLAVNFFFVL